MENTRRDSIAKIQELLEDIDFCMLTTIDSGHLRSRPMSTQSAEFDGDIWFFTSDNTHKIEEIAKDDRVCAAYAKAGQRYLRFGLRPCGSGQGPG